MTDPKMIATRYLAVWNAVDPDHRLDMLAREWTPNAHYVDPLMKGDGRDGVAAMIEAARTQFPGHAFTLSGTPDGHGDFVRFSWNLASDRGAPVAAGTDIVRLDREGRIAEIVGFLDGGQPNG